MISDGYQNNLMYVWLARLRVLRTVFEDQGDGANGRVQDDDQRLAQKGVSEGIYGGCQYEGLECAACWGDYWADCYRVCSVGLDIVGEC